MTKVTCRKVCSNNCRNIKIGLKIEFYFRTWDLFRTVIHTWMTKVGRSTWRGMSWCSSSFNSSAPLTDNECLRWPRDTHQVSTELSSIIEFWIVIKLSKWCYWLKMFAQWTLIIFKNRLIIIYSSEKRKKKVKTYLADLLQTFI